jgi:ubiquinone biosynthesis monooxygenase Coq7
MGVEGIKYRGQGVLSEQLGRIKAALLTFHNLETMAANLYRCQMTKAASEVNRQLIAALCNEMTHIQDFQVKLCEYGWRPSKLRWAFWLVGLAIGLGSRLLGVRAILKAACWVEAKAVHHYGQLLQDVDWDEETRRLIEKDRVDEIGHVRRWEGLLKSS